jgi:hypothetical protein
VLCRRSLFSTLLTNREQTLGILRTTYPEYTKHRKMTQADAGIYDVLMQHVCPNERGSVRLPCPAAHRWMDGWMDGH